MLAGVGGGTLDQNASCATLAHLGPHWEGRLTGNTEQRRDITGYLEELEGDGGGYQAAPGEEADDDPQREGKLQLVA
jgi:hypothetical protein